MGKLKSLFHFGPRWEQCGRLAIGYFVRSLKGIGLRGGTWCLTVGLLLTLVGYETCAPGVQIEVQPIGAPSQLVGNGYTPRAVALRLIDEVGMIRNPALTATSMRPTNPIVQEVGSDEGPTDNTARRTTVLTSWVDQDGELPAGRFRPEASGPDFIVPTVGVSIKSTAAYLRGLFGLTRTITGELTSTGPHGTVALRLRIDGRRISNACALGEQGTVEEVLRRGAREVLCETEPLTLAAYYLAVSEGALVPKLILLARISDDGAAIESETLLMEARFDALERRLDDAIAKYAQAVEHDATAARAYRSWGDALRTKGSDHYDQAIAKYRAALVLDGTSAAAYSGWGHVLYLKEQYKKAGEKHSQALEYDPTFLPAYYRWGNALRAQGHYDEAIERYRQALMLDSRYVLAYNGWGNVLLVTGRYDAAIVKYRQATEHNPLYSLAYFNWGSALREQGKYEEAAEKFALAATQGPDFGALYRVWGETLCMMGNGTAAEEKFRKAEDLGVVQEMVCDDGEGA